MRVQHPNRVALVVHPSIGVLSMASQGLATFSPGYRVATASNISDAADWLETLQPSLIVVSTSIASPDDRAALVEAAGLTPHETILIAPDRSECVGAETYVHSEPVRLDELLAAVRSVAGRLTAT